MKNIPIIFSALFCNQFCYSQFNDSTHHYVNYSSTGFINKTNDRNTFILTNILRFNVNKKTLSVNSASNWTYGLQNRNLTNNDFSSIVDLSLFKQRRFYYWGLANYDKSLSLKIYDRLQVGFGVAYNIIDRKDAWLNISDGILYEKSDLLVNNKRESSHTFRNSLRIRYRWAIKEIFVFEGTNFLLNALAANQDYIIKSNNNLSVKLKKWLSITASVNYNRLNRTNRENLLITYGLMTEKYF